MSGYHDFEVKYTPKIERVNFIVPERIKFS